MQLAVVLFLLSLNVFARATGDAACPCGVIPTNETYVLISEQGDTPDIVSNRISNLSFLTDSQISDAWRLYNAPFLAEVPHNALIRFDKGNDAFCYRAYWLATHDLTLFSRIPLASLSITGATRLGDVTGPDYSRLELCHLDFTAVTNLDALATATNIVELVVQESNVASLELLYGKQRVERIQILGIPLRDPRPIVDVIKRHPANTPNLYVSVEGTLIDNYDSLEKAATGKENIFLNYDERRLPDGYINFEEWNDMYKEK